MQLRKTKDIYLSWESYQEIEDIHKKIDALAVY